MSKITKKVMTGMLCLIMILSIGLVPTSQVNAAVNNLPKVAKVFLEKGLFVEGSENKINISAKDYSGEVQYQLFYTCKELMGSQWKLIDTATMVNGWTKSVKAEETMTVDISGLNLVEGYYRVAVRVKRNGVKGKFENTYGDYDSAAPLVFDVVKKDTITIKSTKVENDNLYIEGNTTIDTEKSTYIQYYIGKKYKDTLSVCMVCDGFNAEKDGSFKLEIPVSTLKGAGTYDIVLEQNTKSNKILAPEHWKGIMKDENGINFGDITSMGEISNLALTVGMKIAKAEFTIEGEVNANDKIEISNVEVLEDKVVLEGTTKIDTEKSTYIQYYIGKKYPETLSECIYCEGFNANKDGSFKLEIPTNVLKGDGNYEIVLEQNTKSNKIISKEHWQAVMKGEEGIKFGDITSMGEISNLALTVAMQTAAKDFTIGNPKEAENPLSIESTKIENGNVIINGKTKIDSSKSTYIQYYIGKEYDGTLSNCIICDGINADEQGNFELILPIANLKGTGKYKIVFEQNPNSNKIIAPNHWKAFYKEEDQIKFGDISAMGELSNLALTVGMDIVETEFTVESEN